MAKREDYVLPSDPKERKKIKDALYEMSSYLQAIADKRSLITDTAKDLKEKYQLPVSVAKKMATTLHKHNYQDVQQESVVFETFYENLFETNNDSSGNTDSDD